jgi:hypothetical protein
MRVLTAPVAVMFPLAATAQDQPSAQRPVLRRIGDYSGLTDRNTSLTPQ